MKRIRNLISGRKTRLFPKSKGGGTAISASSALGPNGGFGDQPALLTEPDVTEIRGFNAMARWELFAEGQAYYNLYQRTKELGDLENAIKCTSRAVALARPGHPSLPLWLFTLGEYCEHRFKRLDNVTDIEKSIDYMSRAVALAPNDGAALPDWLIRLGTSYKIRFERVDELGDLDKAIEYTSRAFTFTPDGDSRVANWLEILMLHHYDRFTRLGKLDDITQSIQCASQALALTPSNGPQTLNRLNNLGMSYDHRFKCSGEPGDSEKSLECLTRALDLAPANDPKSLICLGIAYNSRFERFSESHDLDKAIEYLSRGVALIPDGDPELRYRLDLLGTAYYARLFRRNDLGDLDESIKCISRVIKLIPLGHPDLALQLNRLGMFYNHRCDYLGRVDDIDQSIYLLFQAVNLTPDGDPSLAKRLNELGTSYRDRFERLGELADITKSIDYISRATGLASSDRELADQLTRLGVSYQSLFGHLGELADIEKSIECITRAISLTPQGDPRLPERLNNLGMSHFKRFHQLGELGDVTKSVEYGSHALALTPDDDPALAHQLDCLGLYLVERFERLGNLDDLDQSIEYQSRAVGLTPDGHSDLALWLDSLGLSYSYRFQRLGEVADNEKSIECISRSVALTPHDHPRLPHRLGSLGGAHRARFQRLKELADLERSIEYHSRAVVLTPDDHLDFAPRLANLGIAYRERFSYLDELDDAEKAISQLSRAVALTSNEHPIFPHLLIALGQCYSSRFCSLNQKSDLETAIKHASRALALMPENDPLSPSLYHFQGELCVVQHSITGNNAHLGDALDCFRRASKLQVGSPRGRFRHALNWANRASTCSPLNPIEAYQTAISLLPQFVWLGATTHQRYTDLADTQHLAKKAASAAIYFSNHELALEWLDQARCVVWSQSLMLRSPLDQLHSCHPTIANRLQEVSKQLSIASSESQAQQSLTSDSVSLEKSSRQHRRLAQEYDDLLSQVRSLPGLNDFLQPTKANGLTHAARNGPIVVINCDTKQCDALLVLPGQRVIDHVPLPNFTEEKAQHARFDIATALSRSAVRERGVKPLQELGRKDAFKILLADLWECIVKPILAHLGYMNNFSTDNLPHITWCPTGALSFLPLHAAGDYDQPHARVFNYAVSSYTPTLTALLASTPSSLNPGSRVLAIGQEFTPGHNPLPGTTKELAIIQTHVPSNVGYTQLTDDRATVPDALDAMEQHDWVHLACHAHQNIEDPTRSGFYLHGGTLDLASINQRSFKNKGLAFLSACQTATGDENLPDEAVHLASGMLMAGYTSVIATMWSVRDGDAPFVSDKLYSQLMKEGKVGNGEAGKALHDAVAELREKVGEKEFGRWVPYIHIGS